MEENRKENRQINFRVTEEEYHRLELIADDIGLSVPMFCKQKAMGAKRKAPIIDRDGAHAIAYELRRIGVNINQLTKLANSNVSISNLEIETLEKKLGDLWQLLNSALHGMLID